MKKRLLTFCVTLGLGLVIVPQVWAEAAEVAHKAAGGGNATFFTYVAVSAAFAMALATVGTGLAQGYAVKAAVESIARNPSASGKVLSALLIGLAMIESLAIYTLVIALILLFANPFIGLL